MLTSSSKSDRDLRLGLQYSTAYNSNIMSSVNLTNRHFFNLPDRGKQLNMKQQKQSPIDEGPWNQIHLPRSSPWSRWNKWCDRAPHHSAYRSTLKFWSGRIMEDLQISLGVKHRAKNRRTTELLIPFQTSAVGLSLGAQWGFLPCPIRILNLYAAATTGPTGPTLPGYPPSALLHLLEDGRDPWHSSTLGTGIQQGVVGDGVARDAWTQEADARSSTMLYHKYP